MKKMLLFISAISTTAIAIAQDLPAAGGVSNNIIGHSAFAEAYDVNGRPLTEVNKVVAGSPALNENWGRGQVQFLNGFVFKNVELQFDLFNNELHFKKENLVYAFVDAIKEFRLEFTDNERLQSVIFRSGYPDIQKKTAGTFYKVIADGGKLQLLDFCSKEVRENYTYGGPVKKEYQLNDAYYVYDVKTGDLKYINLSKASIVKAFPAYADLIKKIADEKDYSLKNEAEMAALFKLIN